MRAARLLFEDQAHTFGWGGRGGGFETSRARACTRVSVCVLTFFSPCRELFVSHILVCARFFFPRCTLNAQPIAIRCKHFEGPFINSVSRDRPFLRPKFTSPRRALLRKLIVHFELKNQSKFSPSTRPLPRRAWRNSWMAPNHSEVEPQAHKTL